MKWFVFLVGVSGLVLTGCGSTSSTHTGAIDNGGGGAGGGDNGGDGGNGGGIGDEDGNGGDGNGGSGDEGGNGGDGNGGSGDEGGNGGGNGDDNGGTLEIGEATGVSISATENADGSISTTATDHPVTATYDASTEGQVEVTFEGGVLDGRTLVFDDNGVVLSGLEGGEEDALLRQVEGDHSIGALVDIWDPNGSAKFVAAHTGSPATDIPTSGTVSYSGSLVGAAAGTVVGDAQGQVSITANFENREVDGTVSGIVITDDDGNVGALGDVGFVATMATDRATYSGTDMTIDGVAANDGAVEGGFYGPQAAETAGGLTAVGGNGALVGAFGAERD